MSVASVWCDNGQFWLAADYGPSDLLKDTMVINESSTVGIGDARDVQFLYKE
jgi:hypothetical protein